MIIVYQGEKETYPKNLVVEYDLIKNKCKDENTYLNHLTSEQINKACEDYSQKSTGNKLKIKQLCIDYKLYNTSK